MMVLALTGCVSSALNSVESSSSQADLSEPETPPTHDPEKRQAAVSQMREKAENKSGKKTNVFQDPDGPNQPISRSTAQAKINALDAQANAEQAVIPDEELAAKQKTMADMRKKLQTHYDEQLKKIEN